VGAEQHSTGAAAQSDFNFKAEEPLNPYVQWPVAAADRTNWLLIKLTTTIWSELHAFQMGLMG
jgi:hypothetical protein